MRKLFWSRFVLLSICLVSAGNTRAGQLMQVSKVDSTVSPAGGEGNSSMPVISPDGRYILFASSARNLALATNGLPVPGMKLEWVNVYLRDRVAQTTRLVSVNVSGVAGGNGNSNPSEISTNGRYACFESDASDLVAGDTNGVTDVFVRDLVAGTTTLVSVSTNGGLGNGRSRGSVMTPDGRYVAFASDANNLVAGDTNTNADIFVRDLQTGTTILASLGVTFTNFSSARNACEIPVMTPDGRYVAFLGTSSNSATAAVASEVYVADTVAGTATKISEFARTLYGPSPTNAFCYNHAISDDGQEVAYQVSRGFGQETSFRSFVLRYNTDTGFTDIVHSNATTLVDQEDRSLDMTPDGRYIAFVAKTNGFQWDTTCVLVWDGQSNTLALASVNLTNGVTPQRTCDSPLIDPTGTYVAFFSTATDLTTNAAEGSYHLYVRDLPSNSTTLVNVDTNGVGVEVSPVGALSFIAGGRWLAFDGPDSRLTPNDRNRGNDVFLRDLLVASAEYISMHHPDLPSDSPIGDSIVTAGALNLDGRYMAFTSEGDNVTKGDTNGYEDVFVRDLIGGTNWLVSVATNGLSGDKSSAEPAISANGRVVAFSSYADNLVSGDTISTQDVFVRELDSGTTSLISVKSNGTGPGNGSSYTPVISANGRFVLFRSRASDLAPGLTLGTENLLIRDRQTGMTYALTTAGQVASSMSANGRYLAFTDSSGATAGKIYIWDTQVGAKVRIITTAANILRMSINADGTLLAYWAGSQLFAANVVSGTNQAIFTGFAGGNSDNPSLSFSADSRFLAFASKPTSNGTNQIYLYDFQTGSNVLVSHNLALGPANRRSELSGISSDGRFVVYRTRASDIVLGDTNEVGDVFLYERLSGANTLLSLNQAGTAAGNNWSMTPVLSGDGRVLVFASWASDLVSGGFGQKANLFSYAFLYASISKGPQGCVISWPAVSGQYYAVQFTTNVGGGAWQDLNATVTVAGNRGYATNSAVDAEQKYYRIVSN